MKRYSSTPILLLVLTALICYPPEAQAQPITHSWDDRSDEVWDEFDSGNSATTWILIGAGVGLVTAAVVYTVRKQRDAKQDDQPEAPQESEQEAEQREESGTARRVLSYEPSRLQQLAEVQRRLPVNLLLGVRPSDQRPVVGVTVRF